ncbi:MAG: hypothetical protein IKO55_12710, partial [Kiritimatiellae bacterium]|nr:hypothetical protein [Kiritimatiellia bacterium]
MPNPTYAVTLSASPFHPFDPGLFRVNLLLSSNALLLFLSRLPLDLLASLSCFFGPAPGLGTFRLRLPLSCQKLFLPPAFFLKTPLNLFPFLPLHGSFSLCNDSCMLATPHVHIVAMPGKASNHNNHKQGC